jgi:predicted DsbA family dithiol-disulfide isomerase
MKERLLRATFTEGEPTADHEVLVRLAAEVGLAAEEAREVLASGRYADEVRVDERDAQRFGITGVPFFVVDRTYGVSGAQPAAVLRQVLDKAWEDSRPVQLVATGGHLGPGCDGDACAV